MTLHADHKPWPAFRLASTLEECPHIVEGASWVTWDSRSHRRHLLPRAFGGLAKTSAVC